MITTSERAAAQIHVHTDRHDKDRPISEQFRIVAKQWVDAESAASLLEDTKSAILAQKMVALGDMPVNRAEQTVKASEDWHAYLVSISDARKNANLLKMQLRYIEMLHSEWQSSNATSRAEMRMR
jgi:hypothetical protein